MTGDSPGRTDFGKALAPAHEFADSLLTGYTNLAVPEREKRVEGKRSLPSAFIERMARLLGGDLSAFLAAYERPPYNGLRVNMLKLSPLEFRELRLFPLTPVPWCPSGFLLPDEHGAGKHPFHAAGLYYLQEPSAMAVGELLAAQPGERILDLCAAPGGKATHLAAQLRGEGVLVANEIIPSRARILAENLERWGATNAIITVESPQRLASRWAGFFDRVLADAPCSGEGMFRRSETARQEWRPEQVAGCALRQSRILDRAAAMVRPGGVLAYATCTFAPQENEGVVASFLRGHLDFEVVAAPAQPGFASGRPEWVQDGGTMPEGIELTVRLWPHLAPGEGHFIALFRRQGEETGPFAVGRRDRLPADAARAYQAFCEENLHHAPEERLSLFGHTLYSLPAEAPDLAGLRVLRPGWELGTYQRERFEPSHALAMGLRRGDVRRTLELSPDDEPVLRYLRGEVLQSPGVAGWAMITIAGYPLGWGKRVSDQVKNHYPRALRW